MVKELLIFLNKEMELNMIHSISNRRNYPCLKTQSYLNRSALGLIGEPAVSAMHRFQDKSALHGNLRMSDAEEAVFL